MSWNVCRICLAGNVKTNLSDTQLVDIYEKITNNQWNRDQRPDTICYICHSLLKRCCKLKDMSQQSEAIFAQFFAGGFEFSEETVPILNKRELHNVSVSPVKTFDYISDDVEGIKQKEEMIEIMPDVNIEEFSALKQKVAEHSPKKKNAAKDSPRKRIINDETSSDDDKPVSQVFNQRKTKKNTRRMIDKTTRNTNVSNELEDSLLSETSGKSTCFTLRFDLSNTNDNSMIQNHKKKRLFPFDLLNESQSTKPTETQDTSNNIDESLTEEDSPQTPVKNSYACKNCDKTFYQRSFLTQHKKKVHKRPYSCKECPKSFRQWNHLDQHLRIHKNKRPYVCEVCEKTFTQLSHLNQHRRLHTGETPYSCDLCGKRFKQKSNLVQHSRNHTNEKPFTCLLCRKTFAQLSNLKQHKKTVHDGEKAFSCEYCFLSFGQKCNLQRHITRVH